MASLDISLKDIPSEGLDFASQVTRIDLEFGKGDPEFEGEFEFTARIHAAETEAWVDGDLRGVLVQECVRCLGVFQRATDIPVKAYYQIPKQPQPKVQAKGRKEDDPPTPDEEVESYPILNDRFHLAEMLREQLILSFPIQALCQESCRGLCQVCGHNINQGPCGCEIVTTESPFAVLRERFQASHNKLDDN